MVLRASEASRSGEVVDAMFPTRFLHRAEERNEPSWFLAFSLRLQHRKALQDPYCWFVFFKSLILATFPIPLCTQLLSQYRGVLSYFPNTVAYFVPTFTGCKFYITHKVKFETIQTLIQHYSSKEDGLCVKLGKLLHTRKCRVPWIRESVEVTISRVVYDAPFLLFNV